MVVLGLNAAGAVAADGAPLFAAGAYHACSASSGQLRCWGNNADGELGNGTTRRSVIPTLVRTLRDPILEVPASYNRTCALVAGGRVYCWGRNAKINSKGTATASAVPTAVGVPRAAHGLSVGVTHACVLDVAQAPWCWGMNDRGQIGDGTTKAKPSAVRTQSPPASKVVASDGYTCVVLQAAGVWCWGRSHGNAGDPRNPAGLVINSRAPRPIPGLENATDVSASGDFACAVAPGGIVSCWGENDHGQLGDGTVTGRRVPAGVAGLPETPQIVATANHACALSVDGTIFCWGRGDHGQLGEGDFVERHAPAPVAQPQPAVRLVGAASGHWALAFAADGSAFAWGRNGDGQLGNGGTTDQPIPVPVPL